MSLMTIGEVRAIESLAFEPSDSPHAVKRCVFHRLSGQLKESFAQLLNRLNSLIVGRSDLPDDAKMKFAQRALLIGEMEKRTVLQFEPMNHGLFKALDELSTRDAALRLRSVIERAPDQRIVPYELVDRAVRQNQISPLSGQMYINSRYLEDWLRDGKWRKTVEPSKTTHPWAPDSDLESKIQEILSLSPDERTFYMHRLLPVQSFFSIHSERLVDFAPLKGRFKHYLWNNGSKLTGDQNLKEVTRSTFMSAITPVGHYGEDFAKSLQRTTQVMMDLIEGRLDSESAAVFNLDPELVNLFTARGRQYKNAQAPLVSLQEGVLTMHQVISLLLAEKVDGAATGAQALKMLLNDPRHDLGPVAEFAAHAPMGLTGPSIMRGVYFEKPIAFSEKGLNLSPEFRNYLMGQRTNRGRKVAQARFTSDTGSGCPFASRRATRSGTNSNILKELGIAYWKLFEQLHQRPKSI